MSARKAARSRDVAPPERTGHLICYARVSTRDQDLSLQLDALQRAGCARIYQDVGSGSLRRRPQLDACLDRLLAGDTLIVWRLDRLGRSLRHLVDIVADLEQRGVAFRSVTEAIDNGTAAGKLHLHLFAALAEFERELIRERSQAGREAARARGRQGGRPRLMNVEKIAAAIAMRKQRDLTMAQIASILKVGRSTLYEHLDLDAEREQQAEHAA
ncbi:MAG: recombinase family protein [Solirubrobacteraceae bacterium]